jgi:hypothetical protein
LNLNRSNLNQPNLIPPSQNHLNLNRSNLIPPSQNHLNLNRSNLNQPNLIPPSQNHSSPNSCRLIRHWHVLRSLRDWKEWTIVSVRAFLLSSH